MAKAKEKAVDAEVKEEDVALTTGNDGEVTPDEPEVNETEAQAPEAPEEKSKDEEINEVGLDVPTAKVMGSRPSYEVVNRAAIIFLAKSLLDPGALEDFKTLYPSLFE